MEAFSIVAVLSLLGCAVALPAPCLPAASSTCSTSNTGYSFFTSVYQSSYSYSYYSTDVCASVGYQTIPEYIPTCVYDGIEKMMLEMKCKYLSSYSSYYPTNIGPKICNLPKDQLTYDFVMVSTGPGTLSALESLTEQGFRVALIEEGVMPPAIASSMYYRDAMLKSQFVKPYQSYISGCDIPKTVYVPNCLGGVSVFDSNTFNVGSRCLYDQMAKLNKVFAWENAQSKYKKFERTTTKTTKTKETSVNVGACGCVNISTKVRETSVTNCISTVFSELGYGNGFSPLDIDCAPGLTIIPSISNNGRKSLLYPQEIFKKLPCLDNISLIMGQRIQRLIYECGRISGVEIITENGPIVISAKYDVMLGLTPIPMVELLTRSGIGNPTYLSKFGIDVVRELPSLGQNLRVNPVCANAFFRFPINTLVDDDDIDISALNFMQGGSSLSSSSLDYYSAYLKVGQSKVSNVMLKFYTFTSSMSIKAQLTLCNYFQLDQDTLAYVLEMCESYDLLMVVPQLVAPTSTGCIEFGETIEDIRINSGMFQDEQDILAMIEALQFIQTLSTTSSFRNMGCEFMHLPIKSISISGDFYSSENIRQWLPHSCSPNLHISGGAIMGTQIENSVVDSEFYVHGITNLQLLSSAISPYPMYSDSIAFGTLIGSYGSEIIVNRYNTGYYEKLTTSSSSSTLVSNNETRDLGSSIYPSGNGIGNVGSIPSISNTEITNMESSTHISDTEITDMGSSIYPSGNGIENCGSSTYPSGNGIGNMGGIPYPSGNGIENCGSSTYPSGNGGIPNIGKIPSVDTCGSDIDMLSTSSGSSMTDIDIDMASSNAQSSSLMSNGVSNGVSKSFSQSEIEAQAYSSDIMTSNNGIRSMQSQDTAYSSAEYSAGSTSILGNGGATISEYEASEAEASSSSFQALSSGMGGVQGISQSTDYAAAESTSASMASLGNGGATISEYEASEAEASSSSFQALSSGMGGVQSISQSAAEASSSYERSSTIGC